MDMGKKITAQRIVYANCAIDYNAIFFYHEHAFLPKLHNCL